jgi:hypothetical protein
LEREAVPAACNVNMPRSKRQKQRSHLLWRQGAHMLAAHRLNHGAGAGPQISNALDELFQSAGVSDGFELETHRPRSQRSQASQVMPRSIGQQMEIEKSSP